MSTDDFKMNVLAQLILAAGFSIYGHAAYADPDTDTDQSRSHESLDPVLVTAQSLKGPQLAPSQGSLVATQPQSIVGRDFIQLNDAPAANYTDIIKLTPSVWTVDPNGPGLMENLGTSIRGFQDGQFNVTFDGIPWGDSNDFTHHSTSYFMAQDIGNVVVDRGPGNAATLGDATFGGTVYVQSADPSKDMGFTTLLSFGSFNTRLEGARFDTGEVSQWGDLRGFISIKHISSDGYLTNANIDRTNAFVKIVQPVNDSTDITLASNLNKVSQNPPIGATPNQMAQYGVNYAYNTDPDSQGYFGYNHDQISTDYEYIGINSQFAGWTVDNKIYTYAYYHVGLNGEDAGDALPNGVTDAGGIPNGTIYGANDVPGQELINNYRSVGDILRFSRALGPGDLQFGGWFDHQSNLRALYEVDFTNNGAFNPDLAIPPGGVPQAAYTDRLQNNQLFSREAYVQYVWHVLSGLDFTAGDKYVDFERVLDAPVNQGTTIPSNYERNWTRDLPSLDAHYKIAENWSAYVQWSKGFLAPNLNTLYVANPENNKLEPEATTNVQAGTTWVGRALTVSVDVYTINFSNLIQKQTEANPNDTFFYNLGGVKYKGAEAEGTYVAGAGFSVYANASYNSARLTSDQTWVPLTPDKTAALGVLYNQGPLQGSVIEKYIGRRYGDAEDAYPLGSYATADAAINYLLGPLGSTLKNAKVGVTLQNLVDRKSIYSLAGYSAGTAPPGYVNGNPLFFTIPGRSAQLNLSASF
jgi:iron complex outermembrane receptor protein